MAVTGKTARRLLKFLLTTDPPEIHAALEGLANQLDNDAEILTGKLSERPGFKLFGRMFYVQGDATAANNGIMWLDLGASWVAINGPHSTSPGQMSWGQISSAGAIETGSGDFTVAHLGTGEYEVKWTTARSSAKYAVSLGVAGGILWVGYGSLSTGSFVVLTGGKEASSDHAWSFTVVG